MPEATKSLKDRLMADLQLVVNDTEELLRVTVDETAEGVADMGDHIQNRLDQAKASVSQATNAAVQGAKAAGKTADHFAHDNPWPLIASAVGVGVVLGFLLGRR